MEYMIAKRILRPTQLLIYLVLTTANRADIRLNSSFVAIVANTTSTTSTTVAADSIHAERGFGTIISVKAIRKFGIIPPCGCSFLQSPQQALNYQITQLKAFNFFLV
jgi:hypothetical protein